MNAARKNRWGHRDATMTLGGLPARPAGLRAGGLALGPDGVRLGDASRPPGEAGHAQHPSDPRGRAAGVAAAQARAGAEVTLRVHLGARGALQHCGVCPHGRAGRGRGQACLQGAPAHAQARLWLRASEQGTRYAGVAGLSWPPQHSAHGEIH